MVDAYQRHLMLAIVAALLLLAAYANWRRRHAASAFDPGIVPRYLRVALGIIADNRWVILVPMGFYALNFLLYLPFQLHLQDQLAERYQWYRTGQIISPLWSRQALSPMFLRAIAPAVRASVVGLSESYYGVFGGFAGRLIFMTAALFFRMVIDTLKKELPVENHREVTFLQNILIAGIAVVPVCEIFGYVIENGRDALGARSVLSTVSFSISSGFVLATVSLSEAIALLAIVRAIEKKPVFSSELLRGSIGAFPALYLFNLILLGISTCVTLLSFCDLLFPGVRWLADLEWVAWNGVRPAVNCLSLGFPVFIVLKRLTLDAALRSTTQFMLEQLPNYASFVAAGTAILFLPVFLREITRGLLNPGHFIAMDVSLVLAMLRVCLAAGFAVALVAWIYDASRDR